MKAYQMQRSGLALCFNLLAVVALATTHFGAGWTKGLVPDQGYVVKMGQSYLLILRTKAGAREDLNFSSLKNAMDFATEKAGLKLGKNPEWSNTLMSQWTRESMGKKILFWETVGGDHANRMTFNKSQEGLFFENAFREGSYSTSPSGHALYLVRK